MKTIPITILFAFITILLGCSKESKTIKEDDEKILINAKEILENKNLAGLITKLENTELTEETDINKIPKVILNFLNAILEDKPIANPHENWNPTDVILDKKLPRRKLQYFGSGKNIALMNYFKGGIGKSTISTLNYSGRKSGTNVTDFLSPNRISRMIFFNEGDWDQLKEISWFRFVKVNDGNFDQIINSDNLDLIANSSHTNNWKDENGNVSFRSVSEPLKISQEFNGKKNEKGQLSTPLTETEIYETTSPISSFSFQIYTHRKDDNPAISTDLSKTINIYADNKLIKTFNYAYTDLRKVSGISLKNFNVNEAK
ncbi:hypothetical protein [Kaistella treverensis]|nr:hypothetical protein [Kaistella treverensis]